MIDWDAFAPLGGRMLQELCEGRCGSYREQVFRLERPAGVVVWECRGCWLDDWVAAGRPAQRLFPDGAVPRVGVR